ncbi:MAG: C4-type zinc ribbon domain-containing protein [Phycisphaerae bacterium]
MGPKLRALRELQEVESQIADIRRQLARHERMVEQQKLRLANVQKKLDAEKLEIRRSQAEFDEVDVDIKGRSAHVSKLREHLNTVRTNKEYAAVLTQLNTEKADMARLENTALEMMGKVEARRQALGSVESEAREEGKRLADLQERFDQGRGSFADTLTSLEGRRKELESALDAEAVAQFNRIAQRYDGEAMARLVRVHPRRDDFVCEGCNISLTSERANALMTRDDIQTCKNCGRILYYVK